jgi:hypothetical protein
MMKVDHKTLVEDFLKAKRGNDNPCNPEIFKSGKSFCMLAGPRTWVIEAWVQSVAKLAEAEVDWHMGGGRASVLYLGDEEVYERIIEAGGLTAPALEEAAQTLVERHKADPENTEWCYPCQWGQVPWGFVSA